MTIATPSLQQSDVERILHHWSTMVRLAPQKRAKDFAVSVLALSRRPDRHPTKRQMAIMQRMVSGLFVHSGFGESEINVIERIEP